MVTFLDGRGEPGRQKGWVLGGKKGQSDGCVFHGRRRRVAQERAVSQLGFFFGLASDL
jgi:hypothetical protein